MSDSPQIAASLVLCTFMSAPIMYVSARMVLITYATDDQYSHIISDTQKDVTIVTCICVVSKCTLSNMHVAIMFIVVLFRCGCFCCLCWLGGTVPMLMCLLCILW